jgi:hypothetical protein
MDQTITALFVAGAEMFLFTIAFRLTVGFIQPPIQWVPGAFSLRLKQPEHEAALSPLPRAESQLHAAPVLPLGKETLVHTGSGAM